MDGQPNLNAAWICPECHRGNPNNYRCKNHGCGADLTDKEVERI